MKEQIPFPSLKEILSIDSTHPWFLEDDDAIREILYYKGNLTWKLDTAQKEIKQFFLKCKEKIVVEAVSRQTGKSFGALIFSYESCIGKPNFIVRYSTGAEADALKIIKANLDDLIAETPEDIRPQYKQKLKAWVFPNGSYLYLEGVDGAKANKRRGGKAHLIVIDEAAFISNLNSVIERVYLPMTTTTGGRILIISTPPDSRGHDFNQVVEAAKKKNAYFELNIYDYLEKVKNDLPFFRNRITPEEIEDIKNNQLPEVFAKEYLLKYETNKDSAVLPHFTAELQKDVVIEVHRPRLFQPYVAMDQAGVRDLIAIVFGYYDPIDDKMIIEDELELIPKETNTEILAKAIIEKEKELWADEHGEISLVIKRYCDINEEFMRKDLKKDYGLKFDKIEKTDKKEGVDKLQTLLYNETVLIHPRCKKTVFHLENATWNKTGNSFDRTKMAGHYDFVDAMVYFVRAVKRKKIEGKPKEYSTEGRFQHSKKPQINQPTAALKLIFSPKIRRFGNKNT